MYSDFRKQYNLVGDVLMRTIRYLLWSLVYLTHTTILLVGMKGLLGEEAKQASVELAASLKIGTFGLITLSFVIGTIVYLVCGSGALYLIARMFKWF